MSELSLTYFHRVDSFRSLKRGRAVVWSPRDDQRLRTLYPAAPWAVLKSKFPDRTQSGIQQRASRLGIERHANRKPTWSGAEEKTLRKLFATASWDELCRAIPRHSRAAISQRGVALKLRRPSRSKLRSRYSLIRELRAIRITRRIKQADLAKRIGCHQARIGFWELGVQVPRLPMLLDWVEALGCKVEIRLTADFAS